MIKKEYWINKKTLKTNHERNYIHMRLSGSETALCGTVVNPEFDSDQAEQWEKTDNPKRSKVCKRCKNSARKIKDVRNVQVIESLKTFGKKIIEDSDNNNNPTPKKSADTIEDIIGDDVVDYTFDAFLIEISEIQLGAQYLIKEMLSKWEQCPVEENVRLFVEMSNLKDFINICKKLKFN